MRQCDARALGRAAAAADEVCQLRAQQSAAALTLFAAAASSRRLVCTHAGDLPVIRKYVCLLTCVPSCTAPCMLYSANCAFAACIRLQHTANARRRSSTGLTATAEDCRHRCAVASSPAKPALPLEHLATKPSTHLVPLAAVTFVCSVNCFAWTGYALITNSIWIFLTNFPSVMLGLFYVSECSLLVFSMPAILAAFAPQAIFGAYRRVCWPSTCHNRLSFWQMHAGHEPHCDGVPVVA